MFGNKVRKYDLIIKVGCNDRKDIGRHWNLNGKSHLIKNVLASKIEDSKE